MKARTDQVRVARVCLGVITHTYKSRSWKVLGLVILAFFIKDTAASWDGHHDVRPTHSARLQRCLTYPNPLMTMVGW